LGLDRVPEVGYLRKKIRQVIDQSKTDQLHTELFHSWVTEMPEYPYRPNRGYQPLPWFLTVKPMNPNGL
ncbi:MAG: hypothetical protein PHI28_11695, partial [Mangrovibacterium sp.]|nr:hypothetical protein [Mangrovibacterium sp.]